MMLRISLVAYTGLSIKLRIWFCFNEMRILTQSGNPFGYMISAFLVIAIPKESRWKPFFTDMYSILMNLNGWFLWEIDFGSRHIKIVDRFYAVGSIPCKDKRVSLAVLIPSGEILSEPIDQLCIQLALPFYRIAFCNDLVLLWYFEQPILMQMLQIPSIPDDSQQHQCHVGLLEVGMPLLLETYSQIQTVGKKVFL